MSKSPPMSRQDLPQTITLFNLFKDNNGNHYFRAILEGVRVDENRTGKRDSNRGTTKLHRATVWADRRTTQGYRIGEGSIKIRKMYIPLQNWLRSELGMKNNQWTLNQKDMMAIPDDGQEITIVPEFDPANDDWQSFSERHDLRSISVIEPLADEDGSIHSWEISLD